MAQPTERASATQAIYTVIGHPLNINDLGLMAVDAVRGLLLGNGLGRSVAIVLSNSDALEVKHQGVFR